MNQKRIGLYEWHDRNHREWAWGSRRRVAVDVLIFVTAIYLAITWLISTRG